MEAEEAPVEVLMVEVLLIVGLGVLRAPCFILEEAVTAEGQVVMVVQD